MECLAEAPKFKERFESIRIRLEIERMMQDLKALELEEGHRDRFLHQTVNASEVRRTVAPFFPSFTGLML